MELAKYSSKVLPYMQVEKEDLQDTCLEKPEEIFKDIKTHGNRIGIIMEATPEDPKKTEAILEGMRHSFKKINPRLKRKFIIKKIHPRKVAIIVM